MSPTPSRAPPPRPGPNDLFLFFFSGHGDQVDVPVSAAELDGRAETIELYDAAMTDAQLAPLFAQRARADVDAGRSTPASPAASAA